MRRIRWIAVLLLLAGAFAFVRTHGPGGDGVLARLVLPDGGECLLTQQWNGWTEPYTVSFWFRDRDGEWGWCYVDHEAIRWRDASLRHAPERDSVQVLRAGSLQAELSLVRRTFALGGEELAAPQEIRSPPFVADGRG